MPQQSQTEPEFQGCAAKVDSNLSRRMDELDRESDGKQAESKSFLLHSLI